MMDQRPAWLTRWQQTEDDEVLYEAKDLVQHADPLTPSDQPVWDVGVLRHLADQYWPTPDDAEEPPCNHP